MITQTGRCAACEGRRLTSSRAGGRSSPITSVTAEVVFRSEGLDCRPSGLPARASCLEVSELLLPERGALLPLLAPSS